MVKVAAMTTADFGNGWQLTPDKWRHLYVLEWVYDHADGRPGHSVAVSRAELAGALPGILPATREELRAAFDHLYCEGLLQYPIVYLGEIADVPPRADLTDAGASLVQRLRQRREDPAARRPAARDALLRWLYEQSATGMHNVMLWGFWVGGYVRFLSPIRLFTLAEIDDAARWLHQHGYITGPIDQPEITPEGERMVENDRPVSKDAAAPGGTNITVTSSSGVNIASHSPGATQATVVTVTGEARQHLLSLADYLDQTAGQLGLAADRAVAVPGLVSELKAAASEPAGDRTKLARLLDTMRQLAVGAASVPLGAGLQALINQAVHALGI